MSSLRLALKQSLEEAGPTLTSDENKAKRKGKKRGPKKRKRKSKDRGEEDEDSGMLHSNGHNSLQLDLLRKIKSASSIGGDSIIKGSKSGRSVNSRERKQSSSESESDDGDDSDSSSSSDEESGSNSDSGNSSSSGSSSDSENDSSNDEQPTEDMKGVFDSERSSDEEGGSSPEKRPQKNVALEDSDDDDDSDEDSDDDEEMIHPSQRFKLKKVHSSTASLNSRSRSQSPVNIQRTKIHSHQSVSSALSTSSSKKDKRPSDSEKPKKRKQKTVPAPADHVIAWVMGMSEQKQRRKVRVGMRVKVRFTNPTLQWYGGVITTVSAKGDKIRIKYDDGTKEQSRFPDKEIFVDAENNGEHAPEVQGVVKAFRPKALGMAIGAINIKQKKEKKKNKTLHEQDSATNNVMEVSSPKIEVVEKVEKVEEKMDMDTISSIPDKEIESPPKQESSTNNFPTSPKQPPSEEIKDPEPSTEINAFQSEAKVEADEKIPKETKPEAEQKSAPFVEPASKEKSQDNEENLEHRDKTNTIDHKDQNSNESSKPEIELKNENKDTKSESESTRGILPPKTDIVEEKPSTKAQLETDVPNVSLEKEHESIAVAKEDIADKQIETEPSRNVAESFDAFSDIVSNKDVEKDTENENESMSDDEGEVKKPGRGRKPRKHKLSSVDGPIEEKKSKKRRKDKDLLGHKKKDKDDTEDWVQCDVCSKWRLIPSVKNLPDKWYCELNITDPARSYCSAPEQTPEQVAKERKKAKKAAKKLGRPRSTSPAVFPKRGSKDGSEYDSGRHSPSIEKSMSDESMEQVTSKPGRKKKRTSIQSSVDDEESDPEATPTPQPKRGRRGRRSNEEKERERRKKKEKEEKQQEWVQCEKCEKWRRLPRHIAAKDLPDKWFCSMNDWDPRSASCAVQEDYKVEDEKTDDNAIVSRNEKGTAVGGSKLTYRNLIRRPTRPITERIRAAESIFSTWAHEADGEQSGNPPVVFYANSSVFHKKTPHHKVTDISHQLDTVPKISLFNMMSSSKLWSDLSQGFSNKVFENDALSLAVDALKQSDESSAEVDIMKAMIFFVLKNSQKTADEILLACQMEYWEDKKFMELSASLTYDIVLAILNQLRKDNLVLVSQGEDQIIRFQRFQTGEKKDNGNRQKDVENKYSARSMKFSKPWKRAKSNSN